ncbi:hypothetical protein ABZ746_26730 [Streptomyces sp. NPDC020096]
MRAPTPLLLRDGRVLPLNVPQPAPPLGLGDLSAAEYVVVTEARNRDGVFYPLAARIAGWTKREPEKPLSLITGDLRAYVAGPLADDAAAIAVRRAQRAEPDGDPPDGR